MAYKSKQTISEAYEKFVIRKDGCWDWKGCCAKNPGYGQLRSCGKIIRAHIASWILHKGEIPKGMCVCHTCDNRRCSNPDHLFLATNVENVLDCIRKKRHPTLGKKRDENHMTKIFTKDIPKIMDLYRTGLTQKQIGKSMGVSQSIVGKAIRSQGVAY